MRNDVIPKFKERYGIPIEFIAGRSSEITARDQTERELGHLQCRCLSRRARYHGHDALRRKVDRSSQTAADHAGSYRRHEMETGQNLVRRIPKSASSRASQQRGDLAVSSIPIK